MKEMQGSVKKTMCSAALAMALGCLKGVPRAIESPGQPPLLSSRRAVVICLGMMEPPTRWSQNLYSGNFPLLPLILTPESPVVKSC